MKRVIKNAASFKKLNATQMGKVTGGGYWVVYTTSGGKTITTWVQV
jgi:hypothetical protein